MIRKLAKYYKEYGKYALITPLFMFLEVACEITIPLITAKLINEGIGTIDVFGYSIDGDINKVILYGVITILLACASLCFGALGAKFAVLGGQGLAKNLREAEFKKIQDFSSANIDKFSTSSLITRMTTDITSTSGMFQMLTRMTVRAPLTFIFAVIMAFIINPRIASIIACAIPVIAIILFVVMTKAHPHFKAMLKIYVRMNSSVQENLIAVRVVKSFVREDYEIDKFEESSLEVRKAQLRAEKVIMWAMPIMQVIIWVCVCLIALFGGKEIIIGSMELGDFNSFLTYSMQILANIMMIGMIFMNLVLSRASMQRICEVLDEEIDIKDPEVNEEELKVQDGSIEFKDVNFSYFKDLDNLSLENANIKINSGETIGIIGGTGSSKTTFVSLIPRLYDVTSGELLVGGRNVKEYTQQELRENVAMVLQKNVLFSGTIKDNLKWGDLEATDEEIIEACKKAQAHDFIMSFPDGYETELGQGGVNVSGGQKQRLCIARALLKHPKIIILDDSTSAVDTATDAAIRQAFKDTLKDVTTIIIAQRISSIQDADRIIVMDEGKIDQVGTHEELLKTNEIYQEVYTSQMKGAEE